MKKDTYRNKQQTRAESLIQEGFLGYDYGGGVFRSKPRPFVLRNGSNNLYPGIRKDALTYFKQNMIAWWGGGHPTGHALSSQIACLNHLFPLRRSPEATLLLTQSLSAGFTDVCYVGGSPHRTYLLKSSVATIII